MKHSNFSSTKKEFSILIDLQNTIIVYWPWEFHVPIPSPLRFVSDLNVGSALKLNNLKIGEGHTGGTLLSSRRANFTVRTFPALSHDSRCMIARSGCIVVACAGRRCASLRAVCVAIPYLSLHLCNPRFIADDYARMEVRATGGWGGGGGGGDGALAHGYRTAAIDWRDRDVVLDVSLLSMPNTVLYLLVEERISLYRSSFLHPSIGLSFSLFL